MEFRFYDPDKLVPLFRKRGLNSPYAYQVCWGCVFTNVPPEDCVHRADEFKTPSVQSELMCEHCFDTIKESGMRFQLSVDPDFEQKVSELQEILERASL
jgi:hypothetical protein